MAADTDALPGGFRARVDISSAGHSHACEAEAFLHFIIGRVSRSTISRLRSPGSSLRARGSAAGPWAVLATMAKQEAKRLSERVIAGMRRAAVKGTKSGKPIGRPRGSMPRRKGRSSGFCGAARASTGRLVPSASGLSPFSGSGSKWALSKAWPWRDAAKNKTARAVERCAGPACRRSAGPGVQILGVKTLPEVWDSPLPTQYLEIQPSGCRCLQAPSLYHPASGYFEWQRTPLRFGHFRHARVS